MDKRKRILVAAAATALACLGFAVPANAAATSTRTAQTPAHSAAVATPQGQYCGYDNDPTPVTIEQGSSGPAVQEAQCLLTSYGYSVGPAGIDGQFGPDTRAAVVSFQQHNGLAVDGIVGPNTWYALRNDAD